MADFDVSAYLASKAGGLSPSITPINQPSVGQITAPRITPIAQPLVRGLATEEDGILLASRLMEASQQKQYELTQARIQKQIQLAEANKGSLVSRLGLSHESTAGQAVDFGAQVVSGTATTASQLLTAAPSAYTTVAEATGAMSPEYANRVREGIKSFDKMFTDTPKSLVDSRNQSALMEGLDTPETNAALQRLSNTSIKDLGTQTISDLGTLVGTALTSAGDNPAGVVSYLANNIPQIGLAIASAPASAISNAGYALQNYNEWRTGFAAKHGGREPTTEEHAKASAQTSGLFLAELFGDAVTGGIAKGVKSASKPLADTAERTFKDKLLEAAKGSVAPVTGFAAGAIPEAITEGVQTYLEGELNHKPATPMEIYQGAAVGGLIGGSFGGTAGVAKNVASTLAAVEAVGDKYIAKKEAKAQATAEQIKRGEISSFTKEADASKNDYVTAADVLVQNSNLEGKTEEDIAANVEKIDTEIVSKLKDEIETATLATADKTQLLEEKIKTAEVLLEADPSNEDVQADLVAYKTLLDTPVDPAAEKVAQAKIAKLQTSLDEVIGLREGLAQRQKPVNEGSVISEATAITSPVEGSTEAAVPVSQLLIRAGRLSTPSLAVADSLEAVAKSGNVTAEEANALTVTANEIRATKALKDVQNDVIKGSSNFVGISNYNQRYKEAVSSNDKVTAAKAVKGLTNLVSLQNSKLSALTGLKPLQAVFPVRGDTGVVTGYEVKQVPANYEAEPNSGVFVYKSAKALSKLISSTEKAVNIGSPILAKMALDSGVKSTGVTSVKQAPQTKQTSQERQENLGKGKDAGRVEPTKQTAVTKEVNATTATDTTSKQKTDKATTSVNESKPDTASKPSEVSKVVTSTKSESPEALDKRAIDGWTYLDNPPADYTPEQGKKTLAWATDKLTKAKEAKASATGESLEAWADTVRSLERLKAKAEAVVEGDISLADLEVEVTQAEMEALVEEALPELLAELDGLDTENATVADVSYLSERIEKLAAFLKCMKG